MTAPAVAAAGWASDIPGAVSALNLIASKLTAFDQAGRDIYNMEHQAATLQGIAHTQGNTDAEAKALAQRGRLAKLYTFYGKVDDQLSPVREWLSRNGFGVIIIPVIVAVAAVAALVGIAYVIEQASTERQQLDALAAGLLTPDQLIRLRQTTKTPPLVNFDFGAAVPWVIGAGALYFFGPKLLAALRPKAKA